MRWYWIKIILGALAIFLVGLGVTGAIREATRQGRRVAETNEPIRIPLAFLPFHLDGARAGTFRQVVIERLAPDVVDRLSIRVKAADSLDLSRLAGCRLTLPDSARFNLKEGLICLSPEATDSGLVTFGEVTFVPDVGEPISLPLLLPARLVEDIRREGQGLQMTRDAIHTGEGEARAEAERIRIEVRVHADSIARDARMRADSIARAARERADSIVRATRGS